MVMLAAFKVLLAGVAVAALVSLAISFLLRKLAPDWAESAGRLNAGSVVAHLGSSFVAAAAGGYVTAWMSSNPLTYVLALALILLVLAGLGALQQRGKQSMGYLLVSVAIAPLGVVAGGFVQLRASGVLP